MALSNQPPKGTSDWLPEELKIRHHIFSVWRKVCRLYGYEEYLTPLVESADIYRAKSGEDVGGKELVTFTDQGGRELSIRPEMTPSVTRLISQVYESRPKPIRWFSIANFMRNEKPQRGRNREFWQLNCDIFGSDLLTADLEIVQIALDVMLAFGAPKNSFVLKISHRQLINEVLKLTTDPVSPTQKTAIIRLLDKWQKMDQDEFKQALCALGVAKEDCRRLLEFIQLKNLKEFKKKFKELADIQAVTDLEKIINDLEAMGYDGYVGFGPEIFRGFDYYDGIVFEVYDNHPDNNRALFGGGRYNSLAEIFGSKGFPAVGFAPGDETTRLFLASWGLLDKIDLDGSAHNVAYLPLLDEKLRPDVLKLAKELRAKGEYVEVSLDEQKIIKALDNANRRGLSRVIIYGSHEAANRNYLVKDMNTGQETEVPWL